MPVAMTVIVKFPDDVPPGGFPQEPRDALLKTLADHSVIPEGALRETPPPFTFSPLLSPQPVTPPEKDPGPHGSNARTGPGERRAHLRVCWLDDAHLSSFREWAPGARTAPVSQEGGKGRMRIEGALVRSTPAHRWSRHLSYAQLFTEASDSLRNITLKFCTPTLLHREGTPYPLPDPGVIFLQYLDLWNRFSGIPLHPGLRSILARDLLLVDFRLRSRPAREGGTPVTRFSGSASFRLRGRHPETALKGLNALADYAFFCGTGSDTDRGRGMTRRIGPGKQEAERSDPAPGLPFDRNNTGRDSS